MINDLMKPRLTQLQTKYASVQKTLAEHEEEKKQTQALLKNGRNTDFLLLYLKTTRTAPDF